MQRLRKDHPLLNSPNKRVIRGWKLIMAPNDDLIELGQLIEDAYRRQRLVVLRFVLDRDVVVDRRVCWARVQFVRLL